MEKDFEHIQSILGKVLHSNKKVKQAVDDVEAKKVVQNILGDKIQLYIQELKVKGEEIIIRTHESVLKQELQMHKESLLVRINELTNPRKFTDIIVRN